jgi:hypothetical protein
LASEQQAASADTASAAGFAAQQADPAAAATFVAQHEAVQSSQQTSHGQTSHSHTPVTQQSQHTEALAVERPTPNAPATAIAAVSPTTRNAAITYFNMESISERNAQAN